VALPSSDLVAVVARRVPVGSSARGLRSSMRPLSRLHIHPRVTKEASLSIENLSFNSNWNFCSEFDVPSWPGGLWPDDQDGHLTGDPILHDTDPTRYKVFFYCNATALVASVVIVFLLLNSTISKYKRSLLAMKTAMVLDLLALLGAFAAGSCRKLTASVYVLALVIAVFIYIVIHIFLSFNKMARSVRNVGEQWIPCLNKIWALIETEPSNHQPSTEEP
jgi:predicted RND superfamily exporter protein